MLALAGAMRRAGKALSETGLAAEWRSVLAARQSAVEGVDKAGRTLWLDMGAAIADALEARKVLVEEVFDVGEWIREMEGRLEPALIAALTEGFRVGLLRIVADGTFDAQSPRVQRALALSLQKARSVPETARGIADTVLRDAIERELPRSEMARLIRERFEEVSAAQAERLARTSGGAAFEAGQQDAYLASGIGSHQWLSARVGPDRRENHIGMDGETVRLGEMFSNGLEYPLDPNGPASEVINCQCTTLPILAAEKAAPRSWRAKRNARIVADYPALRDEHGHAEAKAILAEREALSEATVQDVLYRS